MFRIFTIRFCGCICLLGKSHMETPVRPAHPCFLIAGHSLCPAVLSFPSPLLLGISTVLVSYNCQYHLFTELFITPMETLYSLRGNSSFSLCFPAFDNFCSPSCLCELAFSRYLVQVELYSVRRRSGPSMFSEFLCMSEFHSFEWLNNVSLDLFITCVDPFIHQWTNVLFSIFW